MSESSPLTARSPMTLGTERDSGALVLADGTLFRGRGLGAIGRAAGEVVFNTAMTGYQEILTDPSYAAQIITFTFPHIGNVGANDEDVETAAPAARGCILGMDVTAPSSWRAAQPFESWLAARGLIAVAGIDTRRLTRHIRNGGAPNGVICHAPANAPGGGIDTTAAAAEAAAWPGLVGMDLAREVTCRETYRWTETRWQPDRGYGTLDAANYRVVAVDYGAKRNILRCLAGLGCAVTVVPATADAAEILGHRPDGIFLSNGPGDPAATGAYAVPTIRDLLATGKPIFGICLGHQMLALALGGKTVKMHHGHHGANHPVKELATGKVEITSMNHGFAVDGATLPAGVTETHVSLFDGSNCGLAVDGRPVFSVQYHPEASPGPQDSHHLFDRFVAMMADA